jgi:hypothetical protein
MEYWTSLHVKIDNKMWNLMNLYGNGLCIKKFRLIGFNKII